jgi:hypothetical protein
MATTKNKQVLSTLEAFKETGLITKKDVVENQEELHELCTDVIVYADGFYIQMLSDVSFYYNNKQKENLPKEVIFSSKVLDEVEAIVFSDYLINLINNLVSSKTQS